MQNAAASGPGIITMATLTMSRKSSTKAATALDKKLAQVHQCMRFERELLFLEVYLLYNIWLSSEQVLKCCVVCVYAFVCACVSKCMSVCISMFASMSVSVY